MKTHLRRRAGLAVVLAIVLVAAACRQDVTGFVFVPRDGQMQDFGATTTVSGVLQSEWPDGGELRVQGVVTPFTPRSTDPARPWTATVTLDPNHSVTEVVVTYTAEGVERRQVLAVVDHPSAPDQAGTYADDGVGMRFTNNGLSALGPIIQDLASGSFDLDAMLVGQTINTSEASGTIYEAGAGNISLVPTATASGMRAVVTIQDLYVGVNLDVSGIGGCRLDVVVPSATVDGYYDLAPGSPDPNAVDVNLKGGAPGATNGQPAVSIPTVNHEFTSGACDPDQYFGIISDIAGSSVPDAIRSAFTTELRDPDAGGPADSPIADAVEQALAGISIAGPVGDAVGAHLDSPLQAVTEDGSGVTFRSDADFGTIAPGGAPTCTAPPGAPDIQETGTAPSGFPSFGATTPVGNHPYGLGLTISPSAFNQMIGAMTECGLLNSTVTSILGQPVTPATLSLLMPQFATLIPAGTSTIEIRVRPTVAPYLTGETGPNGEPGRLAMPNLQLDFMQTGFVGNDGTVIEDPQGFKWLSVAIDTAFGFDLTWDAASSSLKPTLTPPPASQVRARVVHNSVQVAELPTEALFQTLFPTVSAGLTSTFAAFPLPGFLGLDLSVIEIAKVSGTYVLYANLTPAPATHVEGFSFADQGTANFAADDTFSDSNEWRHRIRKTWGSTSGNAVFQSSLSADSIAAADEEVGATGAHQTSFTVVPATPGGAWRLELNHSVLGAYTCRSEGAGGGECRSGFYTTGMGTNSPVNATVRVNGGAAQSFSFNPSPQGISRGGGNTNVQFSGSNQRVVTGTGTATIVINYSFSQRSGSYCGGFLCLGDGHESSLRMGVSDTLSNNFTAGEYPGQGNRQQNADGHRSSWKVCTDTGAACP